MNEERNRTTPYLVTVIVVLVALLAFLAGRMSIRSDFGWQQHGLFGEHMMGGGMMNGTGDLAGADVMFLQMMIPHHAQAVEMADMAIATSTDAELLAIARAIKVGQTAEIAEMRRWLVLNGATEFAGHHMNMGSMLTDSQMAELSAATGTAFDQLWLAGMIEHHQGALHMITMIDDSDNAEMRDFAHRIDVTQTREIRQMQALLQ